MKLNIYGKKDGQKVVIKTYEADTYDLEFGPVEDVAQAVNLDALQTGSNAEIIKMVGDMVLKSMSTVRELMKDIFPGLTDEELRHTTVKETAAVLVEVVKFTLAQLQLGAKGKN